jgi:hypothetical protein
LPKTKAYALKNLLNHLKNILWQIVHHDKSSVYSYIFIFSLKDTKKIHLVNVINFLFKGNLQIQKELESLLSEYLGVQESVTFSMGFATNALNIPTLVGKVKTILF